MSEIVSLGKTAKLVSEYFETKDVSVSTLQDDLLTVGWQFEGGWVQVAFKFAEDDTHVHVEGFGFINVSEEKYDSLPLLKMLNECNYTYTHVKFVLNPENGQICAQDDDVIQVDSCGPECFELMKRMVRIVEDAYPKFIKALSE